MTTNVTRYPGNLGDALNHLIELIEQGVEFPDAAWSTARQCNVWQVDLEAAYDDYCGNLPD